MLKLKELEKRLELQTFEKLRGMTGIYLSKICVYFLNLSNFSENGAFLFEITQNKVTGLSLLEK